MSGGTTDDVPAVTDAADLALADSESHAEAAIRSCRFDLGHPLHTSRQHYGAWVVNIIRRKSNRLSLRIAANAFW